MGRGGFGQQNILVQRFLADEAFAAIYQERLDALRAELFASGVAAETLDSRSSTLLDGQDIVAAATVEQESDTLRQRLAAVAEGGG